MAYDEQKTQKPREIVHDLKNCMSVVLLNVGDLKADPGHMSRDTRAVESLENMTQQMNCLLEELAKLLGEQGYPKKTSALRTRLYHTHYPR